MAELSDLRKAIAKAIKDVVGDEVQVSDQPLADPTPPTVQVLRGVTLPNEAFGGGHDAWQFIIQAIVSLGSVEGAQITLDEFVSGRYTLVDALLADPQLGGLTQGLTVKSISPDKIGRTETGAIVFADWDIEIYAARS